MRLGTRLTLAFLAVALIPAGAILTLTWFTVEARFEEEFTERLDGVASGLRTELDLLGERIREKIKELSETEEVERILVDMIRGTLDRRALIRMASKWMRAWDLDLLTVLDGQGKVLSCGHLPARYGSRDDASYELAARQPLTPSIRRAQVSREGRIEENLAVVVGASRRFADAEVHIVGGRLLDQGFVEHLEKLSGAVVAVVDQEDRVIAGANRTGISAEDNRLDHLSELSYRRIPLGSDDESSLQLQVVVGVSRDKLEAAQRRILIGSVGAALAGVVFSWLLGLLLSRRITRPVNALVECARSIATGDLDHRVAGEYTAEIGELVRTFNSMVSDLGSYQRQLVRAERVAAWQEIARRIAHEIKNPLSPIQVSIESMRKAYAAGHPDFAEIFEESTRATLEEVSALKRIVTEFSNFARLPKPTPSMQTINPIVESAISLYRNQLGRVASSFSPAEALPDVFVDKELIGQVMANLLANALQAVGESGEIRVSTGRRGDRVFFRVEDDGCGMAPDVLARVFTPYFTTRQDGTGLGLAIVQRIVEDHEGSIEIDSTEGVGTTVTVYLPVRQD